MHCGSWQPVSIQSQCRSRVRGGVALKQTGEPGKLSPSTCSTSTCLTQGWGRGSTPPAPPTRTGTFKDRKTFYYITFCQNNLKSVLLNLVGARPRYHLKLYPFEIKFKVQLFCHNTIQSTVKCSSINNKWKCLQC